MQDKIKRHKESLDHNYYKKASPLKNIIKSNTIVIAHPSPQKFIRKPTRYNSSIQNSPTLIHHQNNSSVHSQWNAQLVQNIDKSLDLLQAIQIKSHRDTRAEKRKLLHMRSCSQPNIKQTIISDLIEQLIPKKKKNIDTEIEIVMHSLTEEKKQKNKTIEQGKNLLKQQEWQIQQLKSRLDQYK